MATVKAAAAVDHVVQQLGLGGVLLVHLLQPTNALSSQRVTSHMMYTANTGGVLGIDFRRRTDDS